MVRLSRFTAVVVMLSGLLPAACNSSSTSNAAAPTTARCALTLTGTPPIVESIGGSGTVSLAINRECAWSAKPEVDWIAVAPASGQGEAQVSFNVASNPQPVERKGVIVINEQRLEVTQRAACAFTLSPAEGSAAAGGVRLPVTVTTAAGCAWHAVSNVPWITVSSGASGAGPGTVALDVSANPGAARTGDVLIAGVRFPVAQAAVGAPAPPAPPAPPTGCQFSLSASSAAVPSGGGTGSVDVAADSDCAWTAESSAAWLVVTTGGSGTGPGEVRFSASPNAASAQRTARLTIAGIVFTVTQAGAVTGPSCTYSLSTTTESVPVDGGTRIITITAPSGCSWTAASSASWLAVTAGVSGTGPGDVQFSASANPGSAERTGTLTIAGITVTVTQAGTVTTPSCTYSLSSTTESVPAGGGNGTIGVTAPTGCNWTAASSDSWLTVTSGASGSGNGTVAYSAAAHTGTSPRDASLTIADQTVTVNQEAAAPTPCTFSVSPSSVDAPASGVSGSITLTASAPTCDWTASASPSWITLTSPMAGTGSATVAYSVAENTATTPRTGQITIGGEDVAVSQSGTAPAPTSVSGVISSLQGQCPTLTFVVATRTVRTTSSTDFRGGSCGGFDDGDDVTVTGTVETDNSITATVVRKN